MPILAVTERFSGRTRHQLARSRDMDYIASMIETLHILEDGPPEELRADPEIDKESIKTMCARHSIQFRETPARSHNKIGAVERSLGIFKVIVRKFLSQRAMCFFQASHTCDINHLVKAASFATSIISGSHETCPFERAKGYMPMVCGLPQSTVSEEMKDAFSEKRAMDAVEAMMKGHNPNTVAPNLLRPEHGRPKTDILSRSKPYETFKVAHWLCAAPRTIRRPYLKHGTWEWNAPKSGIRGHTTCDTQPLAEGAHRSMPSLRAIWSVCSGSHTQHRPNDDD